MKVSFLIHYLTAESCCHTRVLPQGAMNLTKLLILVFILIWRIHCSVESFQTGHDKSFEEDKPSNYDEVCSSTDFHQEYNYVIRIDPTTKSNGDGNCNPKELNTEMDCPDINTAFKFHRNSTAYVFATGSDITHYLKEDSNATFFTEVSDIAFIGNSTTDSAQIECSSGAGLGFWNTDRIRIQNIEFSYCGVLRVSTSRNFSITEFSLIPFKIGLFFYNCTDISFCQVTVQHGPSSLGVCMYDVDGTVNVYDSNFTNNTFRNSTINDDGGGGFIVEFSYCVPSHHNMCNATNHQMSHNKNSKYTFYRSNFYHNEVKATQTSRIIPSTMNHNGLGQGGGLALYFKSNASNNSIQVIDCQFKNNKAMLGGGLYILFGDTSMGNQVEVERTVFEENSCDLKTKFGTGGGMRITSLLDLDQGPLLDKSSKRNSVTLTGSHFVRNRALQGGALSYSLTHQIRLSIEQTTLVRIIGSTFQGNVALLGAAVHLEMRHIFSTGLVSPVLIENCTIEQNSIDYVPEAPRFEAGMGVIYAFRASLNFTKASLFTDNHGSAVAIVGTHADFCDSDMSFVNNRGDTGGALALLGDSHIIINDNTKMYFAHNLAREGGAIYNYNAAQGTLRSNFACFIRYHDPFFDKQKWKASFTFFNNTSTGLPRNSIFSTSVYPCALNEVDKDMPLSQSLVFCINPHWTFKDSNCTEEIKTLGDKYIFTNKSRITSLPGQGFVLPISVFDDLKRNITNSTGYMPLKIKPVNECAKVARVDSKFSLISENYLVITGQENNTISLELESSGARPYILRLEIDLQKCPPGFYLKSPSNISDEFGTCECYPDSFQNTLNCSTSNYRAQISWNYWIGKDPTGLRDGKLVMGLLPNLYSEQYFKGAAFCLLPNSYDELDEAVCGVINRTGPLCGRCKDGYSTAVNSYDYVCIRCDNTTNLVKNIFLFLIFAYVPCILLIIGIIFFNLKLTSSAVTGFILYAQMISIEIFSVNTKNHSLFNTTNLRKSYLFVYGIFNLDSFADVMDPFCIGRNFNTLDVLCLEYTLAILPIMIILMIYLLTKLKTIKCLCCQRKKSISIRSSINFPILKKGRRRHQSRPLLHALASFILLSFTKFSFITMRSLAMRRLFDENGIILNNARIVLAGHLSFTSREFLLPYGMLAILFMIVFVLLPPLFLLGIPQLIDRLLDKEAFSHFRRMWPTLSIHAFLDAFQGYHKPNRRIFVGLYFGFRLCIIAISVSSADYFIQFITQQVLLTIMIVLVAVFRPYKREVFNFVDTLLFLNLSIINSLSIIIYGLSLYAQGLDEEVFRGLYLTQYCFIWFPLIYMLAYLAFKIIEKAGLYRWITAKMKVGNLSISLNNSASAVNVDKLTEDEDLLSDSDFFRRAEDGNRYRSFIPHHSDNGDKQRGSKAHTNLVGVADHRELSMGSSGIGTY